MIGVLPHQKWGKLHMHTKRYFFLDLLLMQDNSVSPSFLKIQVELALTSQVPNLQSVLKQCDIGKFCKDKSVSLIKDLQQSSRALLSNHTGKAAQESQIKSNTKRSKSCFLGIYIIKLTYRADQTQCHFFPHKVGKYKAN